MGRNRWIQIALLISGLIIVTAQAQATTRKIVNHGQDARQVITFGTPDVVSTPAGEVAFFGQDYVDRHDAKRLLTSGSVGSGAAGGVGGGIGGAVRTKQSITIKPTVGISKASIANLAVNSIKGGVVGVAATAAVMWAIEQIPGASFDPQTGQPVTTQTGSLMPLGNQPGNYYWRAEATPYPTGASVESACRNYVATKSSSQVYRSHSVSATSGGGECVWGPSSQPHITYVTVISRSGSTCPVGGSLDSVRGGCYGSSSAPFTEQNYQDLTQAVAAVQNSEWLRDLIKASCNGATNPAACYESLVERRKLMGPAQQQGPKTSTTTTTTNPDGSTSTTTTTSQDTYSYSYGDNYYDYSTSTRTETTTDGQTKVEESTDALPEGEEPTEEPSEENDQDFEGDFQDAEFPEVEPFYEQKYPDGLEGVWQSRQAEIDASAFVSFLQSFIPNFSGSCPAYGLSFDLGFANYGSHGFDLGCYVFEFIGVIIMVTALFTARALIFGG